MSLRETILAKDDISTEMIEIPEWGVTIEVRGMNGADRSAILDRAANDDSGRVGFQQMYVETVIATAFDPETGEKVFTDDDRDVLLTKNAAALDRLATVGMRLSGMNAEAQDDAVKRFPETAE